jgi:hypothetical protein
MAIAAAHGGKKVKGGEVGPVTMSIYRRKSYETRGTRQIETRFGFGKNRRGEGATLRLLICNAFNFMT